MKSNPTKNETPFDNESIEQLSPEKRGDMIRIVIKRLLAQHPEGLTAQDLAEASGLSVKTVRKHLSFLTAVREVYQKRYRTRLTIFFPNGKLVHPYSDSITEIGDSMYSFQRVVNTFGRFLYIQERKRDLYTNRTKTVGGIMIEEEGLVKFIEKLKEEDESRREDHSGREVLKIGR